MFPDPCANKHAPVRVQRRLEYDKAREAVKQYIRHQRPIMHNMLCYAPDVFSAIRCESHAISSPFAAPLPRYFRHI